ncbi:ABC transporter [Ketogulonicigenium robustum]|uniref:Transport permease protein n=1 Tax=Ketogulonicigenium robustum TaxID=92947 RepID=A0A1W6NYE6_9RHOB|nr:ABC transporter permease [Ketogulonicigenium robustum]ARO14244.1 ABC transporter [Ketogulonicigenium robustum]
MIDTLQAIHAIWKRDVQKFLRDRALLVGCISRPLLWVVIMGIGLGPYFRAESFGQIRFAVPYTYLQFIFPAVISLNIMFGAMQAAMTVIADREYGFAQHLATSPRARGTIMFAKALGSTTIATLQGAIVLLLAPIVDVSLTATQVLTGLGAMAAFAFAMSCFAIFLATRTSSFEGFGLFSNAVLLPLYFTSNAMFPIDPALGAAQAKALYPEWMVILVSMNPITYVNDLLRGIFIGFHSFSLKGSAVMIAICAAIFFGLALLRFLRIQKV